MPTHIHVDHDLHIFDAIGEPSVDGKYYLEVTKTGTNYTYEYIEPIVTGTAAPTVTPGFIGQTYIDTTNKSVYVAVGATDSGDFELMNGP